MSKIYKEPNKSETETTINVLYSEDDKIRISRLVLKANIFEL